MGSGARLRPEDHAGLPWRLNAMVADFDLIDAWALPATGSADRFDDLCEVFSSIDPGEDEGSAASRLLFAVRTRMGDRFGWDDQVNVLPIPGCEETSLRQRLPADLPAATAETAGELPFRPVYRTDDEWALELSNATVHAIIHLGWAPVSEHRFRGQLGIYVKTRGRLGGPYMHLIAPFRRYVVYPALLRRIERRWERRAERLP